MQRKIVEENILAYACKMQAFDSVKPSVNMQGPKWKDGPVISENWMVRKKDKWSIYIYGSLDEFDYRLVRFLGPMYVYRWAREINSPNLI